MNLTTYTDLVEAISDLQVRGFNRTFELKDELFSCIQTSKSYKVDELSIVEHHRYKGQGYEKGEQIIFVIKCIDGEQGYIISPKELNLKIEFLEFMDKVKIRPTNKK